MRAEMLEEENRLMRCRVGSAKHDHARSGPWAAHADLAEALEIRSPQGHAAMTKGMDRGIPPRGTFDGRVSAPAAGQFSRTGKMARPVAPLIEQKKKLALRFWTGHNWGNAQGDT